MFYITLSNSDIESEKSHQNLLQGVENYDKSSLKPAETLEKSVLPAKEGKFLFLYVFFKFSNMFYILLNSYLS